MGTIAIAIASATVYGGEAMCICMGGNVGREGVSHNFLYRLIKAN
jgi:hypothetical protein